MDKIEELQQDLDRYRGKGGAERLLALSARNGFDLKLFHTYFSLYLFYRSIADTMALALDYEEYLKKHLAKKGG